MLVIACDNAQKLTTIQLKTTLEGAGDKLRGLSSRSGKCELTPPEVDAPLIALGFILHRMADAVVHIVANVNQLAS